MLFFCKLFFFFDQSAASFAFLRNPRGACKLGQSCILAESLMSRTKCILCPSWSNLHQYAYTKNYYSLLNTFFLSLFCNWVITSVLLFVLLFNDESQACKLMTKYQPLPQMNENGRKWLMVNTCDQQWWRNPHHNSSSCLSCKWNFWFPQIPKGTWPNWQWWEMSECFCQVFFLGCVWSLNIFSNHQWSWVFESILE